MVIDQAMKEEIGRIVQEVMPSAEIARIDTDQGLHSHGDPSWKVKVVVRRGIPREETKDLGRVVTRFRSWLAARGDDRFPYFALLSEQEERELQHVAF